MAYGNRPDERKGEALMSELDGVEAVLKTLTAQEEQVIRLRFAIGAGRKHTHKEVAQRFSLTGEQIRQIELTAFRKLRQRPYPLNRRLQRLHRLKASAGGGCEVVG